MLIHKYYSCIVFKNKSVFIIFLYSLQYFCSIFKQRKIYDISHFVNVFINQQNRYFIDTKSILQCVTFVLIFINFDL